MKFLIADDEVLVRITVQKALNDCGIENSYIKAVDCGEQMIKALSESKIDIAFVDIRMPDISGLTAIKRCLLISPDTSYYILTGYERFDYAAEAIHLGVRDFLLKPLSTQMVSKILSKEALRFEAREASVVLNYSAIISRMLLGQTDFCKSSAEGILCLPGCLNTQEANNIKTDQLSKIQVTYPSVHFVSIPYKGFYAVFFCCQKEAASSAVISSIITLLRNLLYQPENSLLTIVICSQFVPLSDIKMQLDKLVGYAAIRVTSGLHRVYRYNESILMSSKDQLQLAKIIIELQSNYESGNYLACSNMTRELSQIIHSYSNAKLQEQLPSIKFWLSLFYQIPEKLSSGNDLIAYFQKLSEKLLTRSDNNSIRFSTILEYIEAHCTEDISVSEVASVFNVSSNYLSAKFKKESGVKFTDHVTALRISRAKKLLRETNMQIKDISRNVGYYTASHFIRSFVKSEGITPMEYRNAQN